MNKSSKRWKVFVIVLCMLFTMTPGSVFANDLGDPPIVDQTLSTDGNPLDPGTPPKGGDPTDSGTPPEGDNPPDNTTPPGIPGPVTPPDKTTPPAIPDPVTPPAFQMMFTAPVMPECTGTITIEKKLINDPGTDETFTFEIWKEDPYQKVTSTSIEGAGTVTVDGLIPGEYIVKEVFIPSNYEVIGSSEQGAYIKCLNYSDKVTFTNLYTVRRIEIVKKIRYELSGLQDTFTFEIWSDPENGESQYVTSASITGAGSVVIEGLASGKYNVKEVDIPQNYKADKDELTANICGNKYYSKLPFINEYKSRTITINKQVIGDPESPSTFTFEIWTDPPLDGEGEFVTRASIVGSDSVIVEGFSLADYKVKEVSIPQYYSVDMMEQPVEFSYFGSRHQAVTFKNTFSGPTNGSLKIEKSIRSEVKVPETVFDFTVSGPGVYSETVSVTAGAFVILDDLEPGDYTVTEVDIPEGYTPEENGIEVEVHAGSVPDVVHFTNVYDDPNTDDPTAYVKKYVAEYDGVNLPTAYYDRRDLTELNKTVIFKIDLSCNDAWGQEDYSAALRDSFNGSDVTEELLVLKEGVLTKAAIVVGGYPNYLWLDQDDTTFYYIIKLTENGTYTNTASLYKSEAPQYRTSGVTSEVPEAIASSSAVVTVVSETPGPGPDPDPKPKPKPNPTHYYEVTYDPNYPAGAEITGTVPKDPNDYTYNSKVSVRGNTGDLKAGTYTFEGWNTKADGTGTMYLPGNTFNIKEDTILYAQWKLVGEPVADDPGTDHSAAVSAETADLDDVPKTGDAAPLIPMLLLGLLSVAAISLSRKKILD